MRPNKDTNYYWQNTLFLILILHYHTFFLKPLTKTSVKSKILHRQKYCTNLQICTKKTALNESGKRNILEK